MSSSKYESADLILKLYEMRREPVMREARQWMAGFHPQSGADITAAMMGEHGAYFRMVTTYWDMAASLVLQGAIDEEMFNEANGEHVFVYAKIEPFIPEMRQMFGPLARVMPNLEKLVMRLPDAADRLAHMRAMQRRMAERRAQAGNQ